MKKFDYCPEDQEPDGCDGCLATGTGDCQAVMIEEREIMQKIILVRGLEGEEIVATFNIPQSEDEYPQVILFEDRVFQYDGTGVEDEPVYIEVDFLKLTEADAI